MSPFTASTMLAPIYSSENRVLNFIVLLRSEIISQYSETALLPRFHHDQERKEYAALVSFT